MKLMTPGPRHAQPAEDISRPRAAPQAATTRRTRVPRAAGSSHCLSLLHLRMHVHLQGVRCAERLDAPTGELATGPQMPFPAERLVREEVHDGPTGHRLIQRLGARS
jgi:hypothetical protein